MAWALQDCDRTLKLGEKRKDFYRAMKENLKVEKELRKKAEEQLETRGGELEGARAELRLLRLSWLSLKRHLQSVRRTP